MDKLEKVIKGLKYCIDYGKRIKDICNDVPCEGCPYCKYRDIRVGYGDCIDRLHSDAIDILKAQEPNNGWISVKDRLPDRNTQYLIALSTGGVTSGWYFGDCGGFFVSGVCITENVSYWQQLPEPPKEGNKGG